jgi:hypothetical protein
MKPASKLKKKSGPGPKGGRPSDWLRSVCLEILDKHDVYNFLGRVVSGQEHETKVTREGEVVRIPAAMGDRLRATELLLDRAYGKSPQAVEVSGQDAGPVKIEFVNYVAPA